MNTGNVSGIDMPQANTFNSKDSTSINPDKLEEACKLFDLIMENTEVINQALPEMEEIGLTALKELSACAERVAAFNKKMLLGKLQIEFEVGKFYPFEIVETKLSKLYNKYDGSVFHYTGDLIFDALAPNVEDLDTNNWFKYEVRKGTFNGKIANGILITELLINN